MAATQRFIIDPLPGPFGAVLSGIDLSGPLSAEDTRALIDAFHRHQVVVLPDQELEFEDFDRVTKAFGAQKPHFLDHLRMRGHPAILMLSNRFENDRPLGVYEGAAFWHTDVAYQDPPNSATMVYCLQQPTRGCPTHFADMYTAYDDLPRAMKGRIDDMVVRHHYGNRADMDENSPHSAERLTPEQKAAVSDVFMPLVRRHHVIGRKALYGVAGSSFGIVGLPDDEAIDLLDELKVHATQDRYRTLHDYGVGDFAAWDTFATLHMATVQQPATNDADARLLWRVSVTGKPPCHGGG